MMSRGMVLGLVVLVAMAWLIPAESGAQPFSELAPPTGPTITGTGIAIVPKTPSSVRMQVEVLAKGKAMEATLSKLKERREVLRQQIEQLGALKESIKFGPPMVSTMALERQRALEQMVRQRMRGARGGAANKIQIPQSITLSCRLTAEWPLKSAEAEQVLLILHTLQEKVKALDLAGAKQGAVSPEEQELAEEMGSDDFRFQMERFNSDERQAPGVPHFLLVAKVAPQEREKALSEAFGKARAEAEQLAKAAGVPLGPLVGISGGGPAADAMAMMPRYYYGRQERTAPELPNPNEAIGDSLDEVALHVYVGAIFALGKAVP